MSVAQRSIAAIMLVLLFLSALPAVAAVQPVATVLTTIGENTIRKQGADDSKPLAVRNALYPGDIVSTGKKGKCSLLFSDGSQVRLNENSRIELAAPSKGKEAKSLFRVVWGKVWVRIRPGHQVTTRSAVAGARGTEFELAVDEAETTVLTVVEGQVEFFNEFGSVVALASQQSTARLGSAPTAPVTVENAGFVIEWTLDLERAAIPRERPGSTLAVPELDSRITKAYALVDARPGDASAHFDYGIALLDRGLRDDALKQFGECDRIQPDQAETLTGIGDAFLEMGSLDESRDAFDKALGKSPDYAPALVGRAYAELRHNLPAEAEKFARQAVASAPNSAEARIALGLALLRQPGKADEAKKAFEAASLAEPADCRYQANAWLALYWLSKNDLAKAVQQGEAATRANGGSALAHGNLALAYLFADRTNDALREAGAASALNPNSVAARVALAQSMLAEGQVDSAAATAAQAVALDPDLAQAHYVLGIADAQRRDYVHAERNLKQCLRIDPDFMPAISMLARTYIRMGRNNDAEAVLKTVEERNPDRPEVLSALAAVRYNQSRYALAIALYNKAISQAPETPRYYIEKAMAALDANRLPEAIRSAQTAVQLSPNTGSFHAILGLAYKYSLMQAQSEREFRTAIALDPLNALALVELGLLNRDGDLRTSLRTAGITFVQGFLYDPAISQWLLRGGVKTEVEASAGKNADGQAITNRTVGDNGKLHTFLRGSRRRDQIDGEHSESTVSSARLDTTYQLTPNSTLYAHGLVLGENDDLPGRLELPEPDDTARGRFGEAIAAGRWRFSNTNHLWLGLFGNRQSALRFDPDHNSSIGLQEVPWLPIFVPTFEDRSSALNPEVRADFALGRNRRSPLVLTLGAARLHTRDTLERSLFEAAAFPEDGEPDSTGILTDHRTFRSDLGYVQLAGRPTDRLSFTAQLRRQTRSIDMDRSLLELSGFDLGMVYSSFDDMPTQTQSYWLPSLVANYVAGKQTLLRLFASRRLTDVTSSIFAPTETLLTTEDSVLPNGLPDITNLLELDVEKYLAPGRIAKLFVFRSTASNAGLDLMPFSNMGGFFLGDLKKFGAGLRFESALAENTFGHVGATLSRTTADLEGATWDGTEAPYQPAWTADAGLNYISAAGLKADLLATWIGPFFEDFRDDAVGPRPRFPGHIYLDTSVSWEPTVRGKLTLGISNLLDGHRIAFNSIDLPGRRWRLVWTGRR